MNSPELDALIRAAHGQQGERTLVSTQAFNPFWGCAALGGLGIGGKGGGLAQQQGYYNQALDQRAYYQQRAMMQNISLGPSPVLKEWKNFPRPEWKRNEIWERRMNRVTAKRWIRRRAAAANALYVLAWIWGVLVAVMLLTATLGWLTRLVLG